MVLSVPARLTLDNRRAFQRRLVALIDEACKKGETSIVLDLSRTEDLDAAAVSGLVVLRERAMLNGIDFELRDPSETVRHLLILSGLL